MNVNHQSRRKNVYESVKCVYWHKSVFKLIFLLLLLISVWLNLFFFYVILHIAKDTISRSFRFDCICKIYVLLCTMIQYSTVNTFTHTQNELRSFFFSSPLSMFKQQKTSIFGIFHFILRSHTHLTADTNYFIKMKTILKGKYRSIIHVWWSKIEYELSK